jgi:hypothetical protein
MYVEKVALIYQNMCDPDSKNNIAETAWLRDELLGADDAILVVQRTLILEKLMQSFHIVS